ncbi:MAG: hypothetical protein HRT72_00145 [Flavobacteriales bacterium]|nr:hypothetical protein [Flavobacteriales bacterium]
MTNKDSSFIFSLFIFLLVFGLDLNAQKIKGADQDSISDPYEMGLEKLMQLTMRRSSIVGFGYAHDKGEFEIEYQKVKVAFLDNFELDKVVSSKDLLYGSGFGAGASLAREIPDELNIDEHRLRIMYSPWNESSISVESGYRWNLMRVISADLEQVGKNYNVISKGFTDTKVMLNLEMIDKDLTMVLLNMGVSLPTGAIDQKYNSNVFNDEVSFGYIMQTGSGTFDPIIESVYMRTGAKTSIGLKGTMINRIYTNENNYRYGHHYSAVTGIGRKWMEGFGTTFRFDFNKWNRVVGVDSSMDPMLSPINRAENTSGVRLDGSVGIVFDMPKKNGIKGLTFIADFRYPIYQMLDGPQLGIDNQFVITVKYTGGDNKL